jgi:hypothetical protein
MYTICTAFVKRVIRRAYVGKWACYAMSRLSSLRSKRKYRLLVNVLSTPKEFIPELLKFACGMVTREFEIVGENVIDAGLRPGLINKSVDYYVCPRQSSIKEHSEGYHQR